MIWPQNLVSTTVFYTLHDHSPTDPSKAHGWSIGRYRYFLYVLLGAFVWYWIPGFIAPFLSVFAFATFIKPNNVVINQLFGGWTGVSLIPITFDWTQVTGYTLSPLVPPWFAIANTLIGMVIFFWFTTIALHFSGHWYAAYLPISDSNSWDNTGNLYNVSKICECQTQATLLISDQSNKDISDIRIHAGSCKVPILLAIISLHYIWSHLWIIICLHCGCHNAHNHVSQT